MGRKRTVKAVLITLILTLLIVGGVAAFLVYRVAGEKNKTISDLRSQISKTKAYVFTRDLKAGSVITPKDIELTEITNTSKTSGMYLNSKPNPDFGVDPKADEVIKAGTWKDSKDVKHDYAYYYMNTKNEKEVYKKVLLDEEVIGRSVKANVSKNTPVIEALLYAKDGFDSKDVRLEELNEAYLQIPTDLYIGDYIDVRIQFPTGEDYSVLVGKKVEKLGIDNKGDAVSSSIYVKMSEEDIMLMGSAIIEAYMQQGVRLYATKYTSPDTQLFKETIDDLVTKYEEGVKEALAAKNAETDGSVTPAPQYNESGELIPTTPVISSSSGIATENALTIEEIASYARIKLEYAEAIKEAKEANDEDTLAFFREFRLQTKTPITKTYAVKDEVAAVVSNNPNLLETIKAEFDTRALANKRIDKYKQLQAQYEVAPVEKPYGSNEKTKAEIQSEMDALITTRATNIENAMKAEVEAQKARRVAYLQNLLGITE